jgi:peptide/nickel transport system permease protein
MVRYVAQRLLSTLLVAVAIVYFGFLAMHMMNNWQGQDPGYHWREDAVLALEDSLAFAGRVLRGDLGEVPTVSGPRPVMTILSDTFERSAGLLLLALGGAALIGLLVGIWAAVARRSSQEYVLLLSTIVGISAPSFLLAVLLQHAGITYTRTFGKRLVSMGGFGWDFDHMAMPLIVLGARPVAYLTRASYLALKRIMEENYIRTALAKGLSLSRTVVTHAMKNFAIPFLTALGISLRFSLSTLPLVEFIFGWPGLGLEILRGIEEQIPLLVVSIALIFGLSIQLISVTLDMAYVVIDPRLRSEA